MTTKQNERIDTNALPVKAEFVAKTRRDDWDCFEWRVTVTSKSGHWSFPYYCGLAHSYKPKYSRPGSELVARRPSNDDILHSLILDASAADANFHDWCADFGYSDDSIKAMNTYKSCLETATMLRKHFGRDVIEQLREQLADL